MMTKFEIREEVENLVNEALTEATEQNFTNSEIIEIVQEFELSGEIPQIILDEASELIWQYIDSHEFVIYTHHAKEVVNALNIDIFDCNPLTGERFDSWHQASFSGMYEIATQEIDHVEAFMFAFETEYPTKLKV